MYFGIKMNQYKISNIKKTLKAIRHSIRGLKIAFLTESALRLEIGIFIILIPLSFVFKSNFLSQILLITPWFLVIIVELINTAIETIVDRIGLEHHQLSARAKDIGSAAVFIAILNAAVIWLFFIVNMLD
jgi:diacylglycerol kinase (ATP)